MSIAPAKKSLSAFFCNLNLEKLIFILAIFLHFIIFFTIATDNNGDPNEYIYVAKHLFSSDSGYSILRFVGYPFFIKITSLNLIALNLTLLIQHVLLLYALWHFANTITTKPILRALIYLPALIPAVAYLPNLLFPDSLILSLLLIFSASLFLQRYIMATVIGICLILTKLVFIFLPVLILGSYFLDKRRFQDSMTIYFGMGFLSFALIPAVFIYSPFPLYQSIVQKPAFMMENSIKTAVPDSLAFSCGGRERFITDPEFLLRVTEHSSDWAYMPLGQRLSKELSCSPGEIKDLQRDLIVFFFRQAPIDQLGKLSTRFFRNTLNFIDVNHVGYMMMRKYYLLNTYYSFDQYYEKTQLEYFIGQEMAPLRLPSQVLLRLLNLANEPYELLLAYIIVISLIAISVVRVTKNIALPRSVGPMIALIFIYSFCITFFAIGVDRYIFINYFLWFGVISAWLERYFELRLSPKYPLRCDR